MAAFTIKTVSRWIDRAALEIGAVAAQNVPVKISPSNLNRIQFEIMTEQDIKFNDMMRKFYDTLQAIIVGNPEHGFTIEEKSVNVDHRNKFISLKSDKLKIRLLIHEIANYRNVADVSQI